MARRRTKGETTSGEARGASERARANERRNEDGVRDKLEVTRRYYTRRDSPNLCSRKREKMRAEGSTKRERERRDMMENGDGKWDTAGAAVSTGRSSGDEVVTVRRCDGKVEEKEEEKLRRDAEEAEERISGDSMRGEPYVEERASQIGPLALLVARKAGSC